MTYTPTPDTAAARHKSKIAQRKGVQDAEVASKTIVQKGLLMVHTGPGKGKSTAAFGLVLRAMAGRSASCGSSRAPGTRESGASSTAAPGG